MLRAVVPVVQRELRRRLGSYLGVATVVALGGGAGMAAFLVADRTEDAYPRYVRRSDVNELVINPSLSTESIDAAIRSFDDVRSVHADDLLATTVSVTTPARYADMATVDTWLQARGSVDGRYVEVDRPVVTSGRLATGHDEVFVPEAFRAELERLVGRRLDVGGTLDVAFWDNVVASTANPPAADDVVTPIGVETLTIAGFGHLPDEVLADELYPRQRLILSDDVTARYRCTSELRPEMSLEEALAVYSPGDCSTLYRYYSLELGPGADVVTGINGQFADAARRLTADLPPEVAEQAGYYYISEERADLDRAVSRSTRPLVTALRVFGVVALVATAIVVSLATVRIVRRSDAARRSLWSLGTTGRQAALMAGGPPAIAMLVGVAGATGVAAALSTIGALGSVRDLDRDVRPWLPAGVVVPVAAALVLVALVAAGVVAALAAARTTGPPQRVRAARGTRLLTLGSHPARSVGLRAVVGSRRSGMNVAVLGGSVVSIGVLLASIIFGASLSGLVADPSNYGWAWDAGAITGGGYGDTDVDAVAASLDERAGVDRFAHYAFEPAALLDGRPVPAVIGLHRAESTSLPVLAGRMPVRPGELALGVETAEQLDIDIGDTVVMAVERVPEATFAVVGTVVMPSLGPLLADRTGLQRGVFALMDAADVEPGLATFVGVELSEGARGGELFASLSPSTLAGWDRYGAQPIVLDDPVRPPEIVNVSGMRLAPLILGGILNAAVIIALGLSISVSVRDRRHELGVLRALGFDDRSLSRSVRWQAAGIITIGIIGGVPLGWIAGRAAWRAFADQLGVVPTADAPIVALAIVLAVAVVLMLLAAERPARIARGIPAADALRTQ